jgi:hypothetical protein
MRGFDVFKEVFLAPLGFMIPSPRVSGTRAYACFLQKSIDSLYLWAKPRAIAGTEMLDLLKG